MYSVKKAAKRFSSQSTDKPIARNMSTRSSSSRFSLYVHGHVSIDTHLSEMLLSTENLDTIRTTLLLLKNVLSTLKDDMEATMFKLVEMSSPDYNEKTDYQEYFDCALWNLSLYAAAQEYRDMYGMSHDDCLNRILLCINTIERYIQSSTKSWESYSDVSEIKRLSKALQSARTSIHDAITPIAETSEARLSGPLAP